MKSVRKKKTRRSKPAKSRPAISGQGVSEVTRTAIGFQAFHASSVSDRGNDALSISGSIDGRSVILLIQVDNAARLADDLIDEIERRAERIKREALRRARRSNSIQVIG